MALKAEGQQVNFQCEHCDHEFTFGRRRYKKAPPDWVPHGCKNWLYQKALDYGFNVISEERHSNKRKNRYELICQSCGLTEWYTERNLYENHWAKCKQCFPKAHDRVTESEAIERLNELFPNLEMAQEYQSVIKPMKMRCKLHPKEELPLLSIDRLNYRKINPCVSCTHIHKKIHTTTTTTTTTTTVSPQLKERFFCWQCQIRKPISEQVEKKDKLGRRFYRCASCAMSSLNKASGQN